MGFGHSTITRDLCFFFKAGERAKEGQDLFNHINPIPALILVPPSWSMVPVCPSHHGVFIRYIHHGFVGCDWGKGIRLLFDWYGRFFLLESTWTTLGIHPQKIVNQEGYYSSWVKEKIVTYCNPKCLEHGRFVEQVDKPKLIIFSLRK